MSTGTFIQFILDVLSLGSLYALMALGLVIVYGILKLVNFAYGELVMVAGYTLYLLNATPFPWLAMAVVAILMSIATGVMTEFVAFRPVRAKSVTAVLITSFAFSTLLQNAALLFISPRARNVPLPDIFTRSVQILDVVIPIRNLITIGCVLLLLSLFSFAMKRTVLGLALRAAASQFRMARMVGIPANLIISLAFAISGLFAGIVAFIATVIGGMRSLLGAVVGGYLLALIDVSLNYGLSQNLLHFRDAFTFTFVILILLFRPSGLIKGREAGQRT